MTSEQSKGLAAAAFESWAKGDSDFFSILADDVSWTITGSSPVAGAYTSRRDFIERAIQPIYRRAFVATDSPRGGQDRYGGKHGRRALGWSCGGEGRPGVRQPLRLGHAN